MALVLNGDGPITGLSSLTFPGNAGSVTGLANAAIPAIKIGTGAVLQVVQGSEETSTSISTTTTPTDTTITASITPSSSSSKILILYSGQWYPYNSVSGSVIYMSGRIVRGSTSIRAYDDYAMAVNWPSAFGGIFYIPVSMTYLDSPATISSTTYKIQIYAASGNPAGAFLRTTKGQIILMEIAA
jgi:hypothetical protein